jgi:hypothetical protein
MKSRHAPRLALALLERFVPDSEPLAGDLVEEFGQRRSTVWFWVQVLAAIAAEWSTRSAEIRPLQLVDLQPADAVERTRRLTVLFRPVNLNASPASGVGGLGLAIFAGLVTVVQPGAWWLFLASALAGCALGVIMIVLRDDMVATRRPITRIWRA